MRQTSDAKPGRFIFKYKKISLIMQICLITDFNFPLLYFKKTWIL